MGLLLFCGGTFPERPPHAQEQEQVRDQLHPARLRAPGLKRTGTLEDVFLATVGGSRAASGLEWIE
jgi:hypothetical protein